MADSWERERERERGREGERERERGRASEGGRKGTDSRLCHALPTRANASCERGGALYVGG